MASIPKAAVNEEAVPQPGTVRGKPPRPLYRYVPVPPFAVDEDGYPCEDSMSQDSDHIDLFGYGLVLKRHLRGVAAVHSDLSTHYWKGDPGAVIVPDLFVAFGGEERSYRRSYKLWEDPPPEFVLEVLSKKTWRQDVGIKKDTYEFLGVEECWLYDRRARWLESPLEGYRLRAGAYERIPPTAGGRFESEALGLHLEIRDGELRFFDPKTGEYLRTLDEEADAAEQARDAEAQAREGTAQAKQAAAAAERRAAEAERELKALRDRLAALEAGRQP